MDLGYLGGVTEVAWSSAAGGDQHVAGPAPVSGAVGVPCCCAMAVRCGAALALVQQEISGKTKCVRAFTMATKPGWLAAQ